MFIFLLTEVHFYCFNRADGYFEFILQSKTCGTKTPIFTTKGIFLDILVALSSTCELSSISDPPPISNCFGHLLYCFRLKHLRRRFLPSFSVSFPTSSLVRTLGFPLLLMTKLISINSPSSPLLQSSCESLVQNFQFSIYKKIKSKTFSLRRLHKLEQFVFDLELITRQQKEKNKPMDCFNKRKRKRAHVGLSRKRRHSR